MRRGSGARVNEDGAAGRTEVERERERGREISVSFAGMMKPMKQRGEWHEATGWFR